MVQHPRLADYIVVWKLSMGKEVDSGTPARRLPSWRVTELHTKRVCLHSLEDSLTPACLPSYLGS